ncbi:MAG: hypothetical protein KC543_07700 [Myxococcales bacterium]|nr:hypothetical protein [Myxococcales bacterium]
MVELALKSLSAEGLDRALDKAAHYRLLNDPEPAESICLDVLDADPANRRAKVLLLLTLTDQASSANKLRDARAVLAKLDDPYDVAYFGGLIAEREARMQLARGAADRHVARAFAEALACFERAEALRPSGNDDCLLRWNSCVRTLRRHGITLREGEAED